MSLLALGHVPLVGLIAFGVTAAVPAPPFAWTAYHDAKGRDFASPRWADGQAGPNEAAFVTLVKADGILKVPAAPAVTRVVVQMFRRSGLPDAWYADPAVESVAVVGEFDAKAGGWPVSAGDPARFRPARFVPGEPVWTRWVVTTTDETTGEVAEWLFDKFTTAENRRATRRGR